MRKRNLFKLALACTAFLLIVLAPASRAFAAEMLLGGGLTTNDFNDFWTGWENGNIRVRDGETGYIGECVGFRTDKGMGRAGVAYIYQDTNGTIDSTDNVQLSFWWKKNYEQIIPQIHTLYVDIQKPSSAVVRIWEETTPSGANSWISVNIDVSSYFDETGVYQFRMGADFKNGNNGSARTWGWFDEVSLDATVGDTEPPTVSITDPIDGQIIGGTYTITADAADNMSMDRVEFFYDASNLIGTDNTSPYSIQWNTTAVSDGAHTLTATAYDTMGLSTTSTIVNVTVDNTNPTSVISDPVPSQLLPGANYDIIGTSVDTNFAQYTLEYGAGASPSAWNDIGTNPRTTPVTVGTLGTWDTSTVVDGTYTIRLITTDDATNSSTVTVTVDVDSSQPTVVSANAPGAFVADVLFSEDLNGLSIDPSYFTIDNGLNVTGATLQGDNRTVRLNTDIQTGGLTYTITAKNTAPTIEDIAGNIVGSPNTAQFSGYVDSFPPTVSITDPTNGSFVGGIYTVTADASDDVAVDRVEFYYDGSNLIGTDNTAPYSTQWDTTGLAEIGYTLTATAYDLVANNTTSAPVNVTVENTDPTSTITDPVPSQLITLTSYDIVGTADDANFLQYTLEYGAGASPSVWNDIGANPRVTAVVAGALGTWDTSVLSDGAYTIRLITTDQATNATTATVTVDIDVNPPTVVSATAPTGTTVEVLFNEDVNPATIQASYFTIDNGINVLGVTLLGDNRTVRLDTDLQTGIIYTVTVKNTVPTVEDLVGNIVGSPNTAQFLGNGPDQIPPTVSITDPSDGAFVGGIYAIQATAADAFGIDRVEFFRGASRITTDISEPYSAGWDTTGLAEGGYVLTATAYDTSSNSATSVPVNVTVDNTNPTAAITNPAASQYIGATNYPIVGTATDSNFLHYTLHYGIGGAPAIWTNIGTNPRTTPVVGGALGTWNTSGLSDGLYTLRLITTDQAVNQWADLVLLNVDSNAPTVTSATGLNSVQVDVLFNEHLNPASVQASYFTIDNGLTVNGATLQPDSVTVRLDTSIQTDGLTYTVTVKNTSATVEDLAGNIVGSPNTAQFVGFGGAPTSVITSPTEGQVVAGSVPIVGTATDAAFTEYILEVAKGKNSASGYKDIGVNPHTSPVVNGTLDTWSTVGQNDGDYTIRLTTRNSSAQEAITTVRVIIDDAPPVLDSARTIDNVTVDLLFREHLSGTLATAYFSIPGLTVSNAVLLEDLKTVRLTTSAQTADNPYTVTARTTSPTVADVGGTEIVVPDNTANFTGFNPDTIRGDGMLLRRSSDDSTCGGMTMGCHNIKNHNSDTTSTTYGTWGRAFGCLTCHEPHGTPNIYKIRRTISTPNSGNKAVDFRTLGIGDPYNAPDPVPGTHDFSLGDATDGFNDSVCEVCHTQTQYFRNVDAQTPSPNHNNDQNCTGCHPHTDGFAPASCSDCHNSPQDNLDGIPAGGRREVVSEFGRSSHHLQGAVDDADCQVCHDQGQHQQGFVRLSDVDTAAVVQLNADPSTNSVEAAKLTTGFCLPCHDADGAGGSLPFTDGVTPPDIAGAGWASSSHNANSISCFGDGATFGCHASGHGSQKLKILAPSGVSPTPPNNAEEEEGFCYGCHGASGPATPDISAQFSKAIRHPVVNSDAAAGRSSECADCHNMHAAQTGIHNYSGTATSTRNQVSPVLTGVPGVQFNYSGLGNFAVPSAGNFAAVTSATYEYEICFKCHTSYDWGVGTPPSGLSPNGSVANPVETDVAQEFNPNNMAGHPVVTGLDNYPNSIVVSGKKGLQAAALKAPWNTNIGAQTMMCSDCHNTDSASPAAQGPHGSAVQFMLRGPNSNNWPNHLLSNFTTSWCANCHNNAAGDGHDKGAHTGERCYVCHIVIPHGGKISRLLADHDTMPPRYAYNSTLNPGYNVNGFDKRSINNYSKMDCRAGCSGKHSSMTPSENW